MLHYKLDKHGAIQECKSRVVAQGFSQVEGIDYKETFSPMAKLTAIQIIATLAVRSDWEIEQTDVVGVYLNAKLKDDIFMCQPKGFKVPGKERSVLCLKRVIYGLKQSGHEWYNELKCTLLSIGFTRCHVEHAVFYRYDQDAIVLAVDVDDITITGDSKRGIKRFKEQLSTQYKIKDLGDLNWLLGLEVTRDRNQRTITFGQSVYIQKVVDRFNLQDTKPLMIPMSSGDNLSIKDCPEAPDEIDKMRHIPYKEAIGSLMYAVIGSRPDIIYAVSYLAHFMQNPGSVYWEAVKRVIRYLNGMKDAKLTVGLGGTFEWAQADRQNRRGLEGFSDADGNSHEHRHAILGYVFMIDGGAVSWNLRKQLLVSLSTTESKYVAVMHASKEVLWIRAFLSNVFHPLMCPVLLYCDNMSAIAVVNNDKYHARMKHINSHEAYRSPVPFYS